MISGLLGGVGLFLLGITLMTEGLKSVAGGALRDVLGRFTGGPLRAFVSGAALTALVQSSSATIVTTIGFVSAGLLTFRQAVGVIFGAAVGTTSTGWLVAFLGLRYSVSALALPLVGIGALLRLLGKGRTAQIGLALAGFGLIFVGIDTLQGGMAVLATRFDLGGIQAGGTRGRMLLVLIGIAMTVVMQSSSAAVAITLAALHAGNLGLEQAASLVIGQNMGTTVTAALASIGASVAARRTALAHILLNAFSGAIAFATMPLYLPLLVIATQTAFLGLAETIAIFHTTFNVVGVALLLPLTGRYAAVITRLVPERKTAATRFLGTGVASVPAVAVEAARRAVLEVAGTVVGTLRNQMRRGTLGGEELKELASARRALIETRRFLAGIRSSPESESEYRRHLSVLHASDHIDRILEAIDDRCPALWLEERSPLAPVAADVASRLDGVVEWLGTEGSERSAPELGRISHAVAEVRRRQRPQIMALTAAGEIDPDAGLSTLDAMRWIDRVVYHVWRSVLHLSGTGEAAVLPHPESLRDVWSGVDLSS